MIGWTFVWSWNFEILILMNNFCDIRILSWCITSTSWHLIWIKWIYFLHTLNILSTLYFSYYKPFCSFIDLWLFNLVGVARWFVTKYVAIFYFIFLIRGSWPFIWTFGYDKKYRIIIQNAKSENISNVW